MPGSSRRVRAMSDELPPAGALRLARVAGVPVYLDRTWLLLGAFVAWTGWQNGQRPRHRHAPSRLRASGMVVGILVAVLGHEVAHAVAARLLGFRVHRIVATLWGGHTAYDGTGTTPGRAAVVAGRRPAGQPRARRAGQRVATAILPWPASRVRLARSCSSTCCSRGSTCCPASRSTVASSCSRWSGGSAVAATSGWSSPAGAVGCSPWASCSGTSRSPLGRGHLRPRSASVLGLVMAWILWSGATAALKRAPLERLLLRVRPEDVMDPVAVVVPAAHPGRRAASASAGRVVALDERGMPTLLLPEPSETAPDIATLPPATRLASRRRQAARRAASSSSHRATTPSRCCGRWRRPGGASSS